MSNINSMYIYYILSKEMVLERQQKWWGSICTVAEFYLSDSLMATVPFKFRATCNKAVQVFSYINHSYLYKNLH